MSRISGWGLLADRVTIPLSFFVSYLVAWGSGGGTEVAITPPITLLVFSFVKLGFYINSRVKLKRLITIHNNKITF